MKFEKIHDINFINNYDGHQAVHFELNGKGVFNSMRTRNMLFDNANK